MSAVDRIVQAGMAALPDVAVSSTVPSAAIEALIRERLLNEESPDSLAADEIFLACACAAAVPSALQAFERRYFSVIPAALSRLALGRDEIAEVEQQLRIRLFMAEADGVARVVSYAGRGQLGGLVRVAAVRAGLNLLRDRGKLAHGSQGDDLEDIPIAGDNPELAQLKAQHRAAFKAAFEEAITALPPRERSVLNLAVVKGMGIDKIGAIYGVHRATAARWVASARDELTKIVHRSLGTRLGVAKAEVPDLLPLVESQLELSLERLLRSRAE